MSVTVQYDPSARLGNRMFQLAFGYLLAQERQDEFYHHGLSLFGVLPSFGDPATNSVLNTRSYGDHFVPYTKLVEFDGDIVVDSFLQQARYYTPHREELQKLFNIKVRPPTKTDELALHVRETDYTQIGCCLSYEAYRKLIDSSGCSNVVIATDNSECDTVKRLVQDGCTLYTSGYVDKFTTTPDMRGIMDFTFLRCSSNLALSHSSFSWWAAFLNDHEQILFPSGIVTGKQIGRASGRERV